MAGQSREPFPSQSAPSDARGDTPPLTASSCPLCSPPTLFRGGEGKREDGGSGSDQRTSHLLPGFHFWTQEEGLSCGEEKNMPLCE